MDGGERRAAGVNGTWGTPPCATAGIDFTADKMDARTAAAAVAICLDCPVMVRCLAYLRHVEVAGIAGGMTLVEREEWRARQGLERSPNPLPVWATTPIAELTPADVEGLSVRVPAAAVTTVPFPKPTGDFVLLLLRMRLDSGWEARQIAEFFGDGRPFAGRNFHQAVGGSPMHAGQQILQRDFLFTDLTRASQSEPVALT